MYKFLQYVILPVCAALLLVAALYSGIRSEETKVLNCSLAEFHPDFTPQMKKACRNARNKV